MLSKSTHLKDLAENPQRGRCAVYRIALNIRVLDGSNRANLKADVPGGVIGVPLIGGGGSFFCRTFDFPTPLFFATFGSLFLLFSKSF